MGKWLNRHYSREGIQIANDYIKRYSVSYSLGKKADQNCKVYFTPTGMTRIKKGWGRVTQLARTCRNLSVPQKVKYGVTIWLSSFTPMNVLKRFDNGKSDRYFMCQCSQQHYLSYQKVETSVNSYQKMSQ